MSTPPQTPPEANAEASEPRKGVLSQTQRSRLLLLAGSVASFALVGWAARAMHVPVHPGYEASLFQQASVAAALGLAAIALLASVILGTALAPLTHFNAGLFVGAMGWAAFTARGGSVRAVLQWADGSPAVFGRLSLELILLMLLVGIVWTVVWALHAAGILKDPVRREPDVNAGTTAYTQKSRTSAQAFAFLFRGSADPKASVGTAVAQRIGAVALQVVVTGALMMLLAASADKQQVLAALAISAFFGAAAAEYAFPNVRPGALAWLGLMLTGLIGYLAAWSNPEGLSIAELHGALAPLARALPIDYASVGVAGALAGLWGGVPMIKSMHDLVRHGNTEPAGAKT